VASSVRILFYAINGSGLGHLSRLLAIARSIRDLLKSLDLSPDLRFVTTSEGSGAVWDFPVYKVPSQTVVAQCGLGQEEFTASCRLLVINLIASLRPDVLVTDTVPQGAFGEMSLLTGHVKSMVYIDRHKDPQHSTSEVHLAHLPLYDKILVPDAPCQIERYPIPVALEDRRHFVGYVHGYRPENALQPQEVRDYFGVDDHQRLIFVTGGGGGDPAARASLQHLVSVLAANPDNFLLVGYGPLYQGDCLYRKNVVPFWELNVSRFFRGLDLAIAAAGYNSYHELLAARVPCIFFAQPKGMDRQDERVAYGLEQGWHGAFDASGAAIHLADLSETVLNEAVERAIENGCSAALQEKEPAVGSIRAAAEILGLAVTVGRSLSTRASIFRTGFQACLWWERPRAIAMLRASRCWSEFGLTPQQVVELEERFLAAWRASDGGLVDFLSANGHFFAALAEVRDVRRLCRIWCRKSGRSEPELRTKLAELFQGCKNPRLIESLVYEFHGQRLPEDFRDRLRALMFALDDPDVDLSEVASEFRVDQSFLANWRGEDGELLC
jgi:UDP-N-acetylglucosamine--N-acetylmuramyl-(pentapeptide) pyrophosphoryl-undecaprenol N-acetylglucosamine transferase